MVLEMPAPDSGGDSFYNSSGEHAPGPNPPGPFAKYPTKVTLPPYSILKFLGFWSQARYEKEMTERIINALDIPTVLVARHPTQEETDAFIDAQNRRANTAFLADLVMASGVVTVTQVIRQSAERTHMTLGPASIRLPASPRMRGLLFIPPVALLGFWLGESTSNAFSAVRLAADPRLRGYYTELRKQSPQMLQKKMREYMVQRAKEHAQRAGMAVPEYAQEQPYSSVGGGSGMDDASPTGGAYASEYGQSYDAQQSTIVSMAQQQQQQQEQQRQYYQQQQQQQQQPADQGQSFFDEDDASPTARPVGGWQQQRQQQQAPQQSGSAWGRIRQAAGAPQPGPFEQSPEQLQHQWGQAEQTGVDSFSYSTARDQSQSTQSDRELAQREFDRMVEQERQLGTGAADGNEEKRGGWRRW